MPERVLVTGGSGFIAGHCILQLLEQGYEVRATVRSPAREAAVRGVLADAGMTRGEALTFVAADLTADDGWAEAVADAAGQRFLLSSGPALPLRRIGAILRAHLGPAADRVPSRSLPSLVIRVGALFRPELRAIAPDLGYARRVSSEHARRVLGWQARDPTESIVAAGRSMVQDRPGSARTVRA